MRRDAVDGGGDVRGEQDGRRQVPEPAGDERQHLRGLRVTPVDVVHCGEQRALPGGRGEQTEDGHRQGQPALGRAALAVQRPAQQVPARLGQGGGPVEHRIEQALQAGVRQRGLLGQPGPGENCAVLRVPVGVGEQRRPARARLAVQQQSPAAAGHAVEQSPDGPALVVPAAQHGYLH
ncbi:hypothetical protein B0E54_05267 [Micromonospora sp. MH99]|nr:hypothetical protein [Micromonospora sp. MH99]